MCSRHFERRETPEPTMPRGDGRARTGGSQCKTGVIGDPYVASRHRQPFAQPKFPAFSPRTHFLSGRETPESQMCPSPSIKSYLSIKITSPTLTPLETPQIKP